MTTRGKRYRLIAARDQRAFVTLRELNVRGLDVDLGLLWRCEITILRAVVRLANIGAAVEAKRRGKK